MREVQKIVTEEEITMQLGAQLYTLRAYTQTKKDLAYTLRQVAEMGYQTVQISAVGKDIGPAVIKELCDANHLSIVLTHTDVNRILNDTEQVIEEHRLMGCDYIGIGSMPEKYRTKEWIAHFAEDFKEPAKKIAAAGKLLMYHNHDFEFEKLDGKRMIDTLLEGFGPDEMGFTLDTYWVQAAGADLYQWMESLKDRIPCVHLKDMAVVSRTAIMAPVMEGNLNFPVIVKQLEQTCCQYMLVEQDICQGSPFDCLKTSYDNLRKLGYR